MTALHDDELRLDDTLVRDLVAGSLPEYAALPVERLPSSGSSNVLFRLGDELLVRLPRQPGGSTTLEKEARWMPRVAGGLTVEVPEVVAVGEPGPGYPESWQVVRWIEGEPPAVPWNPSASGSSHGLTDDLARLIAELRRADVPPSALADPALRWYRGGPLAALDADFREAVDACRALPDLDLDLGLAGTVWDRALAAERSVAPVTAWYHGDLLGENLLMRDGRLAAVIDFGGLGIGDPAVDLIVAWEVLDADGRAGLRAALELDEAAWLKSMGWALLIALITFPYYGDTMPSRCAARRAMAATVLDEA